MKDFVCRKAHRGIDATTDYQLSDTTNSTSIIYKHIYSFEILLNLTRNTSHELEFHSTGLEKDTYKQKKNTEMKVDSGKWSNTTQQTYILMS